MDIRTQVKANHGDWMSRFGAVWESQEKLLLSRFSQDIEQVLRPGTDLTDVPIYFVNKSALLKIMRFLKTDSSFEYGFLADLTATDESPEDPRFHLVYNLFSHSKLCRMRIKVKIRENEEAPTLIELWKGANWAEREVFDMFGVRFSGHPDLRRILMDQRWEGHPLRKDYPLKGYQIFPTPEPIDPELLK